MTWRLSEYNVMTTEPGGENVVIANLLRGTCGIYTPIECYLLSVIDQLDDTHPFLRRFAERGLIVNYDEKQALESISRLESGSGRSISLTICPTTNCNFDCPYCFEEHKGGMMSDEVQRDVVSLAEKMLFCSGAKFFHVTWFGGEPLMAPSVIENLTREFIDIADRAGAIYKARIITNGYLLDRDNIDLLYRCRVTSAQITLDGIGEYHDKTRHLRGGGATFDKITENLRNNTIPFRINIRHNVHAGNRKDVPKLKEYVEELARESGNSISFYVAAVHDTDSAQERGSDVQLLCSEDISDPEFDRKHAKLLVSSGIYCGAGRKNHVVVDERGLLYPCWDIVGKEELSYGNAADWDPSDEVRTASCPDRLTCFLNSSVPFDDPECKECKWLPVCAGGCPHQRMRGNKTCHPFKGREAEYVLALYEQLQRRKRIATGVGQLYISGAAELEKKVSVLHMREESVQKQFSDGMTQKALARRILLQMIPDNIRSELVIPDDLNDLCEYMLTLRGTELNDKERRSFCEAAMICQYLISGAEVPQDRMGLLAFWDAATRSEPISPEFRPAHWRTEGEHIPFVHAGNGRVPLGCKTFEPAEIPDAIDAVFRFIAETDLPLEIKAFSVNGQIYHIHPFCDGNGHTGRLMMIAMLASEYSLPTLLNFYQLLDDSNTRRSVGGNMMMLHKDGNLARTADLYVDLLMEAQYGVIRLCREDY